jgi:spondin-1
MPGSSKYSDKCNNLVTHTTTVAEKEIMVTWIAPEANSGCVIFKATVIERRDVWYSDDGPFSIQLCEDVADSGDVQPIVLETCNACSEAKYELSLERLWSKNTHPKDFPVGWNTKFSDVIGASHKNNFTVWKYGEPATEGIKNLAMYGTTDDVEKGSK